jgi:beta-lactamase superfamily II metal-dependent hydrolase
MITISAACSFAAYDNNTKKLTSSIITIGEGATILCNQDELNVSGKDTAFFANRAALVAHLKSKNIKNSDDTEITEDEQ